MSENIPTKLLKEVLGLTSTLLASVVVEQITVQPSLFILDQPSELIQHLTIACSCDCGSSELLFSQQYTFVIPENCSHDFSSRFHHFLFYCYFCFLSFYFPHNTLICWLRWSSRMIALLLIIYCCSPLIERLTLTRNHWSWHNDLVVHTTENTYWISVAFILFAVKKESLHELGSLQVAGV